MAPVSKVLADRGAGTRRECDTLVKRGRVSVDGEILRSPTRRVPASSRIHLDGEELLPTPLLMALYKPKGVHSTMGDPLGRPSLLEATPSNWKRMQLHPVGRLDADTTGLLLFSRDGQLTQYLLHPRNEVEREYVAQVDGDALRGDLREVLAAGVETSDGTFPAELVEQAEGRVRVMVKEGKYRMVRRLLANVGLPVVELHRVRYGPVRLEDLGIDVGEWAPVTGEAVEWADEVLRRGRGQEGTARGGGGGEKKRSSSSSSGGG
eukprot:CAMPEP_0118991640 /NCGR_PEP_ID=MMETSP1173-20130426/52028_1 /TAXON_ID=1034831 /ORGANISM="Rhizochromulina marina cf, Strain CCMP1243" /LENGTH=263 /DNA_ID=CAMNT_0006942779 /DNA_START=36 /DNA_END=823 /DNA_ORIENTATION=-